MKRAILLTWDVEEYDVAADFGAVPLPDRGLARGVEIWRDWLETTARWKAPGTVFVTARLAEAAPDLLQKPGPLATKSHPTPGVMKKALN